MKPKIVFVVMSAVHSVGAVAELARALAPHTVLVHHDFIQTPDFEIREPNVVFVPDPKQTGWAVWGFTDGVFHAMRHAVRHLDFDYLQILSPTCLPIKPIAALERHIASGATEADFSSVDLMHDVDALMSVGYRAFAAEESILHKILRKMTLMFFNGSTQRRDVAGVQLRTGGYADSKGRLLPKARLALAVMRLFSVPAIGRHGFTRAFPPFYGSTWFGARRHVIEWMLKRFDQPDIQKHFPSKRISDEFLIATMLKQGGFRSGPTNHCIVSFVEANPTWLSEADFEKLRQSPAFFARKFPDDPAAPIRRRVLDELVRVGERHAEPAPARAASVLS